MQLSYDLNVDALYISLSDQPVARTREIDDNTSIDLAEDGTVTGIEVISVRHPWPLASILADYGIQDAEQAQLRAYFPLAAHSPTPTISVAAPAPAAVLTSSAA
jgi:uncharacterized protein YuzE